VVQGHAEIAGAGFAGLTCAAALAQRGWSVCVHESSAELRALGAGIYVWENGLRVLKAIGCADEVMRRSHQARFIESRLNDNSLLMRDEFGIPSRGRMLTMTRRDLYEPILAAARMAGVEVHTNSEAVGALSEGVLLLAGGEQRRADLVVGADGVRSQVRDSLDLLRTRVKHRDGVIRLLVPRDSSERGHPVWDQVINFWTADRRVLYTPCNPEELYLVLVAKATDSDAIAIPVNKEVWIRSFPNLEIIIRRIGDHGRYDLYESTSLLSWSKGNVAILGDAAHAMPPTLGQGAGCAMMNALSLAVHVTEADNLESGLERWEAIERPLTDYTQQMSATLAQERSGSDGRSRWTPEASRTALHVPTGT